MREYTLFEAEALGGTSLLGWIGRLISHRRKRRQLRGILDLDDYLLSDIGLTRGEVIDATRLAWNIDPIAELERVSRRASRRGARSR